MTGQVYTEEVTTSEGGGVEEGTVLALGVGVGVGVGVGEGVTGMVGFTASTVGEGETLGLGVTVT